MVVRPRQSQPGNAIRLPWQLMFPLKAEVVMWRWRVWWGSPCSATYGTIRNTNSTSTSKNSHAIYFMLELMTNSGADMLLFSATTPLHSYKSIVREGQGIWSCTKSPLYWIRGHSGTMCCWLYYKDVGYRQPVGRSPFQESTRSLRLITSWRSPSQGVGDSLDQQLQADDGVSLTLNRRLRL